MSLLLCILGLCLTIGGLVWIALDLAYYKKIVPLTVAAMIASACGMVMIVSTWKDAWL